MKTKRSLTLPILSALLALAQSASAQPTTGGPLPGIPATTGETAITLDVGAGIRPVLPSRVAVPAGETLRITGPSFGGRPVQWMKNGRALAGATTNPLILPQVIASDAGTYQLINNEPNVSSIPSQMLILGVGPTDRLLNLSTRGNVGPGSDQGLVSGFVVAANNTAGQRLRGAKGIGSTTA